jgi:hypothetical protein
VLGSDRLRHFLQLPQLPGWIALAQVAVGDHLQSATQQLAQGFVGGVHPVKKRRRRALSIVEAAGVAIHFVAVELEQDPHRPAADLAIVIDITGRLHRRWGGNFKLLKAGRADDGDSVHGDKTPVGTRLPRQTPQSLLVGDRLPCQHPVMSPAFYHIAHLVGLIFVFTGFGALLSAETARSAMKWHGIGLVISLVSGFGLVAKLGLSYSSPWLIVKMALWLVLGFLPVLARRKVLPAKAVLLLAILTGAVLAWLGYLKPAL